MTHRKCPAVVLLAALALTACSASKSREINNPVRSCDRPLGVEEHDYPRDLPPGLRDLIAQKIGKMAAPGEAFDATDVVVVGVRHRAMFVWSRGRRWVLATEYGGIASGNHLFAVDVDADGTQAKIVAETYDNDASLCASARDLLDAR